MLLICLRLLRNYLCRWPVGGLGGLRYFKCGVFALQRPLRRHPCFMSSFRTACLRGTVNVHGLIVKLWWIYMIFMNQMLGVIHHMHCGCRIIPGGLLVVRQQRHFKSLFLFFLSFFFFLSDCSLWNHCRIGFYCPGWWIICCIFLKQASFFFVLVGKLF